MLRFTTAVIIFAVALLHFSCAVRVFETFRLLQYRQDKIYGSLRSGFSLPAATSSAPSLFRHAVLLPAEKLCITDAAQFLSVLIDDQRAEAVVVLLPTSSWDADSAEHCEKFWPVFEREVLRRTYEVPIYFVHRDEQLDEIFAQVSRTDKRSLLSEKYYFEVSLSDAVAVKDAKVVNLQGTVPGAAGSKKTIAVVAHYDTFGIAPGAATNGGSGAVALLQLARMFSDLSTAHGMPSPYTLTFVLTGAGREGYVGAQGWLETLDTPTLESLAFVLCLDELHGKELWLHTSQTLTADEPAALLQTLQRVANLLNVPFSVVNTPVGGQLNWEHEVFARKKLHAATISDSQHPSSPLAPASLVPRSEPSNLLHNIQFIAEAVGHYVYREVSNDVRIFTEDDFIRDGGNTFVNSWVSAFSDVPRVTPYLRSNDPIIGGLEKALTTSTLDVFKTTHPFSGNVTFFSNTQAELRAYRSKPASFDVVLALCVLAYCVLLYIGMAGMNKAVATVKDIFGKSAAKRK